MMIIDSYQSLKDPYNRPGLAAIIPVALSRLPTADLSSVLVEASFLTRLSTA